MGKLINIGGVNKIQPYHNRNITCVTTFSGIGGTSFGYQLAGFLELLAVEWEKDPVETLKLNFPELDVWKKDISKLTWKELLKRVGKEIGELDFFHASPPCQDFSRANSKSNCMSERAQLSLKTLNIIDSTQTKMFVIENVEALSNDSKNRPMWIMMLEKMQSMNYEIEYSILNSAHYGVPQSRNRLIIIGVRNDIIMEFGKPDFFPKPTSVCNPITVEQVIPKALFFESGQYQKVVHRSNRPCGTLTKREFVNVYKRNGKLRQLSIEEILKFSTFPEDYKFPKKTRKIVIDGTGNCVPPTLAQAIGEHIKNEILTPQVLEWCDNNELKNAA